MERKVYHVIAAWHSMVTAKQEMLRAEVAERAATAGKDVVGAILAHEAFVEAEKRFAAAEEEYNRLLGGNVD